MEADRFSLGGGRLVGTLWVALISKARGFGVGLQIGVVTGGRVHPCERRVSISWVRGLGSGVS